MKERIKGNETEKLERKRLNNKRCYEKHREKILKYHKKHHEETYKPRKRKYYKIVKRGSIIFKIEQVNLRGANQRNI